WGGQSSQQQQQPQQYIKQQPQAATAVQVSSSSRSSPSSQSSAKEAARNRPGAIQVDRPVGKPQKLRIVNGEKTVTVTVTLRQTGRRRRLQPARPDIGPGDDHPARLDFRRNFAAPPTVSLAMTAAAKTTPELRETFADEVAKQHNELRQEARSSGGFAIEVFGPAGAESWAELLSQSGRLQHRPAEDFNVHASVGQNIAKRPAEDTSGWDWRQAGRQLVLQWYGVETPVRLREARRLATSAELVWCSSEDLGVGLAVDPDTGDQYAPPAFTGPGGNLAGQFADNAAAKLRLKI
uniref:SCP domain-containing protein n=1 Tax=Macrostomum lignano TaxID=282301 RepID=A0A1I8FB93_9PLAT